MVTINITIAFKVIFKNINGQTITWNSFENFNMIAAQSYIFWTLTAVCQVVKEEINLENISKMNLKISIEVGESIFTLKK